MEQRSVLVPARGRWLSLLGVADLEAVVRAVYRTLGQPTPRGLRGQLGREIDLIRGEGEVVGGFTVDDLSRVLLKVGVPLAAQDGPLRVGAMARVTGDGVTWCFVLCLGRAGSRFARARRLAERSVTDHRHCCR
jgi:hypothetical protein